MSMVSHTCPICDADAPLLDVVDFNKSCEELRGKFLAIAGVPIYYARCDSCGFAFAPELHGWSLDQFSSQIYNEGYVEVDPDYVTARPSANADHLVRLMGASGKEIRHLDYGGGHGLLSDLLRDAGWQSRSYDPFVDRAVTPADLGKFDLVTAYEVFEHVPDVRGLALNLASLLREQGGVVLFSTLISDGNISPRQRITWWYASPRNGHISLFTRRSLQVLAERTGLSFGSFNANFHAFWNALPTWASKFITT